MIESCLFLGQNKFLHRILLEPSLQEVRQGSGMNRSNGNSSHTTELYDLQIAQRQDLPTHQNSRIHNQLSKTCNSLKRPPFNRKRSYRPQSKSERFKIRKTTNLTNYISYIWKYIVIYLKSKSQGKAKTHPYVVRYRKPLL